MSDRVTDERYLQVLRSIDKFDRLGDLGVFDLLTSGRTDESGAVVAGQQLTRSQAAFIVGFLNVGKDTLIARRFWLMAQLESAAGPDGQTAWDVLLAMKPENIGWALDDMFDALVAKCGTDPRGKSGNGRTLAEMVQMMRRAE